MICLETYFAVCHFQHDYVETGQTDWYSANYSQSRARFQFLRTLKPRHHHHAMPWGRSKHPLWNTLDFALNKMSNEHLQQHEMKHEICDMIGPALIAKLTWRTSSITSASFNLIDACVDEIIEKLEGLQYHTTGLCLVQWNSGRSLSWCTGILAFRAQIHNGRIGESRQQWDQAMGYQDNVNHAILYYTKLTATYMLHE